MASRDTELMPNAVTRLVAALLSTLETFERAQRRLDPKRVPELVRMLKPPGSELAAAIGEFEAFDWPESVDLFQQQLGTAARFASEALHTFFLAAADSGGIFPLFRALRKQVQALEALYVFHAVLTPVNRFFLEAPLRQSETMLEKLRVASVDPAPRFQVGVLAAANDRKSRGGYSLYVPEYYDESRSWPLVTALHGGSGHGADFLWTWLREARSRGFLVLAPTARGRTWSLKGPDLDVAPLRAMVEHVARTWNVDRSHTLLTGMSDGATYALLCGLQESSPFSHLAPISGVLHPMNVATGNLSRAADKPVYLVHGALDWMFPVDTARMARDRLAAAGAQLIYREIADLSHTYPREENGRILRWFHPSLALTTGSNTASGSPDERSGAPSPT